MIRRNGLVMVTLTILVTVAVALAQDDAKGKAPVRPGMPDVAAQKAAMQKLAAFVGKWKGTGAMRMGPNSHEYTALEEAAWGLDGLILKIDGRGVDPKAPKDSPPAHHAFAVINYNDREQKYEFRAYSRGFAYTFDFDVNDDGTFAWEIKAPGNHTRYKIKLTNDTWHETGERSSDGQNFVKFLEMNLTKVKE